MDATNPPFTVKEPQPTSFVGDFVAKVIREYDEATEALLTDVVCATPVEHLWRLAIIEHPRIDWGMNFAGQTIMSTCPPPSVCSMIPDIIGGVVYNSTPPAEMLALRNAELERRAA